MNNISKDLKTAIEAAKIAGEIIKKGYGNIQEIAEKKGKGVVTEIDKKSEKTIIETIQKNSVYPILAEETKSKITQTDSYWIVDPLDGTTNYTRGMPLVGISIALMKKGEIKLGIVYNPLINYLFYGEEGIGAFLNNNPIHVSKESLKTESAVFVNYGYSQKDKQLHAEVVERLVTICALRKFGTTALELCFVANGSAEVFLSSGDEIWDYAAGIAIVKAAGGKVTDWEGNEFDTSNSFVFASNGIVHEEVLSLVKGLQAQNL